MTKSEILYETKDTLLRVAWNKNNQHYVAVTSMDQNCITLMDTRKQFFPISKLSFHKAPVNQIAWAPLSAYGSS